MVMYCHHFASVIVVNFSPINHLVSSKSAGPIITKLAEMMFVTSSAFCLDIAKKHGHHQQFLFLIG
jgi:hypothetical protein